MSYIVLGSKPSPFVRKIMMLLENHPCELKELNIYEGIDGIELNKVNPVNQIPVLIDGETTIWNSRTIYQYLNQKHQFFAHDWNDENYISAIDGMIEAGVGLALMKRSGISTTEPYMYVQRLKDRIDSVLEYLSKTYLKSKESHHWNFVSISLISFIDWAMFREVNDFSKHPEFLYFLKRFEDKPIVKKTSPRL